MARCKICRQEFVKRSISHKCCGQDCAYKWVQLEKERKAKKELRQRKIALKTRSDWMKDAQKAFNAFIRERDKFKDCICCGKPLNRSEGRSFEGMENVGGSFDCGHYRSVGSAPHLRFNELNAHGQTKQCNRWGSGRAVDYRKGLIDKIGLEAVEALEADQTPKHYTIDDLKAITALYKAKLKELKNEKG